jgi:hypothetical protein
MHEENGPSRPFFCCLFTPDFDPLLIATRLLRANEFVALAK